MATLSAEAIAELLVPYLAAAPEGVLPTPLYNQLSVYLELLLKWNSKTNLTAIREPEEIVKRHFGESLFAGWNLVQCATLLDFGSGAGFPGLPIQLLHPEIAVTLAESQNKKATFLREAVRTLGLKTEVWGARVEDMPPERRFDVVALRAVDDMEAALGAARARVRLGGELAVLTSRGQVMGAGRQLPLPGSQTGVLWLSMFHVEHPLREP